MSPNTTLAPSATIIRTCEAPIPRAPPLTSATFPANRSATAYPLSCRCALGPEYVVEYAPGLARGRIALHGRHHTYTAERMTTPGQRNRGWAARISSAVKVEQSRAIPVPLRQAFRGIVVVGGASANPPRDARAARVRLVLARIRASDVGGTVQSARGLTAAWNLPLDGPRPLVRGRGDAHHIPVTVVPRRLGRIKKVDPDVRAGGRVGRI